MRSTTPYRDRLRHVSVAALSAALLVTAGTGLLPPPASADPANDELPSLPAPHSHGITLRGWEQVDPTEPPTVPRLFDATMTTKSIFEPRGTPAIDPVIIPIKARVLLPAGYRNDPSRPYPVLYLLHGGAGGFESWSDPNGGDIKDTLDGVMNGRDFPGIVVMPEGGRAGWYTDWYGATDGHFSPQWETYHLDQLIPWIDANFNTVDKRSGRAIAGASMGGFGALAYAARRPSLFGAVASFSGGTDMTEPAAQSIVTFSMAGPGASVGSYRTPITAYRVSGTQERKLRTVFGPPTDGDWPDRNPMRLAEVYNAYDGKLGLYAGRNVAPWGESNIGKWNDKFHAELNAKGVDHRYCTGSGTHSFDYWRNDLKDFVNHVYGTTPSTCTENPGWKRMP